MVGGFPEGGGGGWVVAVANRIVRAIFSEGDVMIDVQQPFARVSPRGFASWGGDQLLKRWEVEIV